MKMLFKRFKYDGKPIIGLNKLQIKMKEQIEKKIKESIYSFESVPCCICGGNNFEVLSEKDKYGLYVPVVICKDCGLIQTNPRMKQESYNQFYDIEYRKLYVGKEVPTKEFFRNQYYRGKRIYHYLENNLGTSLTNLRILEVGTGAGGILYYFKEMGNEICGCDLDSKYLDFGRKNYNLNLYFGAVDDIDIPWKPDIVIYSHIIEHLLNPIDELIKLKSIIGKNSYIYIEVPCIKYMKTYCGGDFFLWIQNAHIYYFTLKTLENLTKKAGYNLFCADEITDIHSLFKNSLANIDYNLEDTYENDYFNSISFLRKMEFYRFLPTAYNLKRLMIPRVISLLKHVGLYNMAKRIYHKFK